MLAIDLRRVDVGHCRVERDVQRVIHVHGFDFRQALDGRDRGLWNVQVDAVIDERVAILDCGRRVAIEVRDGDAGDLGVDASVLRVLDKLILRGLQLISIRLKRIV